MSEDQNDRRGFLAVSADAIAALEAGASSARTAARELDGHTRALIELAEDFKLDATRRLRERGASEAQIEGYERAYAARVEAVKGAARELDAACVALAARALALS